MARFVFEARFSSYDHASALHREYNQSGLETDERLDSYRVAGVVEGHEMGALGLRVMNSYSVQEFSVNRILAEYSAADARRWMKEA